MKYWKMAVALGCAALGAVQGAAAQEALKLKVASFVPETHHVAMQGTTYWMDQVRETLGDAVEFEYYPAQQAGKAAQLLELLKAGALDVVEVGIGYHTDKLPLMGVLEMPGLVRNACEGAYALRSMSDPGGLIQTNDLAPLGVRPLSYLVFPPYSAITRVPVRSLDDFDGLKLRTAGGAMELEVSTLGGVPVKMSSPDIYQSLSRGTLDGVMFTYLSTDQYDLNDVANYGVTGYGFASTAVLLLMTEQRLQSLPEDVRAAFLEAGVATDDNYCSFVDENEAATRDELVANGFEVHEFSEEEVARLDEMLTVVSEDWTSTLDRRGKPGSEALETFRGKLTEARGE